MEKYHFLEDFLLVCSDPSYTRSLPHTMGLSVEAIGSVMIVSYGFLDTIFLLYA